MDYLEVRTAEAFVQGAGAEQEGFAHVAVARGVHVFPPGPVPMNEHNLAVRYVTGDHGTPQPFPRGLRIVQAPAYNDGGVPYLPGEKHPSSWDGEYDAAAPPLVTQRGQP